jgi:hypothetical protein
MRTILHQNAHTASGAISTWRTIQVYLVSHNWAVAVYARFLANSNASKPKTHVSDIQQWTRILSDMRTSFQKHDIQECNPIYITLEFEYTSRSEENHWRDCGKERIYWIVACNHLDTTNLCLFEVISLWRIVPRQESSVMEGAINERQNGPPLSNFVLTKNAMTSTYSSRRLEFHKAYVRQSRITW